MENVKHSRKRAGMTLIEVVVATLVLALGFAGILGTSTHVTRMVRMAREETQAITAAQYVLEQIKTYSWVRLSLMIGQNTFDISGNSVFAKLTEPSCVVTVSTMPGELDRLCLVSARVRWKRMNGDYGERELASYVARKKRLR